MRIHLINPSDISFGTAVITPRWLYVLAAATPARYGDPVITDETLEQIEPNQIQPGDIVGIGIHTGNALRGLTVGKMARERGAYVVFGGVHATLYPKEALELGGAHVVVKGDGDIIWKTVIADLLAGTAQPIYEGGRVSGEDFVPARWDLAPRNKYMWASVQTVRGCPKHCSFCSVWRTDGQRPRTRAAQVVLDEIVQLRRLGFRFMVLADDNFYPVSREDFRQAERQHNTDRLAELHAMLADRYSLMEGMAQLPEDMVFYTQITMEAGEDTDFLDAMRKARIRGALVGVESATAEGLKAVYKNFNLVGDELVARLKTFRDHGVHVLGSFIFGLPTDRADTFDITAKMAIRSEVSFAQFVMLTPLPGSVDFERWEKKLETEHHAVNANGVPTSHYWLTPVSERPRMLIPHPTMSGDEMRQRTQHVWDEFYSLSTIWQRSKFIPSFRWRLAFLLISKLYRQMYANTGIASDSARRNKATRIARLIAIPCRKLFEGKPMPGLKVPGAVTSSPLLPILN